MKTISERQIEAARILRETTEFMAAHALGLSLGDWCRHANACLEAAYLLDGKSIAVTPKNERSEDAP